jgi:hypothetical protein
MSVEIGNQLRVGQVWVGWTSNPQFQTVRRIVDLIPIDARIYVHWVPIGKATGPSRRKILAYSFAAWAKLHVSESLIELIRGQSQISVEETT